MGWGFWEGPDRLPDSKSVYVAISDRELKSKKSLVDVENQTISDLLRYPDGGKGKGLLQLKTGADPELAVLAELAHELGHALVADANMDGIKRYHPRRRVSGPPGARALNRLSFRRRGMRNDLTAICSDGSTLATSTTTGQKIPISNSAWNV